VQEDRRQALAPHFDVTSFATVILPLNPGEYEGGLFLQPGADRSSRLLVEPGMQAGDALLHRFDVMHGVDASGGDRYSLVLWLSDSAESVRARATPWLRAAADGGNAYAQFLHGAALRSGSGGAARDVGAAAEYWRRAAAQGHALSQLELGLLYWRGEEGAVPRSVVESRRLVTAAAEAGLPAAMAHLGWCEANGKFGERDEAAALGWYERAARQGSTSAVEALMYGEWSGVRDGVQFNTRLAREMGTEA